MSQTVKKIQAARSTVHFLGRGERRGWLSRIALGERGGGVSFPGGRPIGGQPSSQRHRIG